MTVNNENNPYKVGQKVQFINGFDAQFVGKIKDIFFYDKLGRYHYSFSDVKLVEESPLGSDEPYFNSADKPYLHSHIKNSNPTNEEIIEKAKKEIIEDIRNGVVPSSVADFGELHDYVDANCYGGICEDDFIIVNDDDDIDDINHIQDELDKWIKSFEKTYVLFGEDAILEYDENGVDAVFDAYENNELGYEVEMFNQHNSVAQILYKSKGWNDYVIITENEFKKLS
jgi:hypothetical protein